MAQLLARARFSGFTRRFALKFFEIRGTFEFRPARLFALQSADLPPWSQRKVAIEKHRAYKDGLESVELARAERACLQHLLSARENLLGSSMSIEQLGQCA